MGQPPLPLSVPLGAGTAVALTTEAGERTTPVWQDVRVELRDGRIINLTELPVRAAD
jgi:hypothetical protein